MTSPDTLDDFFTREGSYEICAALRASTRTRQELLAMIDSSERTIDRRLDEGEDLGVIASVPTTNTERVVELTTSAIPEKNLRIIDSILTCYQFNCRQQGTDSDVDQLHRSDINETPTEQLDVTVSTHADVAGGDSTFF